MLGTDVRFGVYNASGAAVGVTLTGKFWWYDSSGNYTETAELTLISIASGGLADATYDSGTEETATANSAPTFMGFRGTYTVTGSGTSGVVSLFVERTDGTNWTTNQGGVPIASANPGDAAQYVIA